MSYSKRAVSNCKRKTINGKQHIAPDIVLNYVDGSFTSEELTDYKRCLEAANLSFSSHPKPSSVMASGDALTPFVRMILSPDFLAAICAGLISTIAWDVIKTVVKKINDAVMSKRPRKLSKGVVEDVKEPIHIVAGNINFILPSECSDEIIIHAIDLAFEYIMDTSKDTNSFKHIYVLYDEKADCLRDFTEEEIVHQEIKEETMKQGETDDVALP